MEIARLGHAFNQLVPARGAGEGARARGVVAALVAVESEARDEHGPRFPRETVLQGEVLDREDPARAPTTHEFLSGRTFDQAAERDGDGSGEGGFAHINRRAVGAYAEQARAAQAPLGRPGSVDYYV